MRWLLVAVVAAALVLRLWDVGAVGISHWDAGSYTAGPYGIGPYGKAYILPFYAPPLVPALCYAAFETFGRIDTVAIVLMALLGAATVPALFVLGRKLFGPVPATVAAASLAGMEFHVVYSRQPVTDAVYTLLFVLALSALWTGWVKERRTASLAAGVWVGACLLTKYHGMFPLVVFGLLCLATRVPRLVRREPGEPIPTLIGSCKGLVLAAAIAAIPAAWLAWDIVTEIGFDAFRANRSQWMPELGLWRIPQTAGYIAEALNHWVSWFVLVPALVGLAVMVVRRHAADVLVLVWLAVFAVTLPLYINYPRLLLPLLPPLALAAGVGLDAVTRAVRSRRAAGPSGALSTSMVALLAALVLVPGALGCRRALTVSDRGYAKAAAWLLAQGPGELPDLLLTQHAILFYLADAPNAFLALDEPDLLTALREGRYRYLLADLRAARLPPDLAAALDKQRARLQRVATIPNPLPEPFVVNLEGFAALAELSDTDLPSMRREELETIRIERNTVPELDR